MKKFKLLVAMLAAAFGFSALVSPVAADTRTTDAGIEFKYDDTKVPPPVITDPEEEIDPEDPPPITVVPPDRGALAITQYPLPFDFGSRLVNGAELFDKTIVDYEQVVKGEIFPGVDKEGIGIGDDKYAEGVQVYDGRFLQNDWTLSATLSGFADLAGVTMSFHNTEITQDKGTSQKVAASFAPDDVLILAVGTSKDMLTNAPSTPAKGFHSITWGEVDNVVLNVPAASIKLGEHTGTVTWTLSGTPDA